MSKLEKIRQIEDSLKIRILTCEAEILVFLHEIGDQKISDLYSISKFSHVTLHDQLRRMQAEGIIEKTILGSDKRRVHYEVSSKASEALDWLKCMLAAI